MNKLLMILILICLAVILTGCIDIDTPSSTPRPGTPAKAVPRYKTGDVVGEAPGAETGWLILSYSADSDMYTTQVVYYQKEYKQIDGQWRWVDPKWVRYEDWNPKTYRRDFEERQNPYILGYVDPNTVKNYFKED